MMPKSIDPTKEDHYTRLLQQELDDVYDSLTDHPRYATNEVELKVDGQFTVIIRVWRKDNGVKMVMHDDTNPRYSWFDLHGDYDQTWSSHYESHKPEADVDRLELGIARRTAIWIVQCLEYGR